VLVPSYVPKTLVPSYVAKTLPSLGAYVPISLATTLLGMLLGICALFG